MASDRSIHTSLEGSPEGTEEEAGASAPLEVEGLACVRRNRTLFEGLSFRLSPGQLLQVEGANGSGKTSLLRILCLLALAEDGEIRWNGEPAWEVRPDFLAELAYLGHAHGIKADLTALENLRAAAALAGGRPGLDPESALERLGMSGYEETLARELSAGQLRRVALARLLIRSARLWILDEPFTALDREGRGLVEELLAGHCRAGGMAVITTHHPMDLGGAQVTHLHLDGEAAPLDEAV